jgi:hypothetical protein
VGKAANCNKVAVDVFCKVLVGINSCGGYLPEQVFCVDEIGGGGKRKRLLLKLLKTTLLCCWEAMQQGLHF